MKKLLKKIKRLVTLLKKKVRIEEDTELIEEIILTHKDKLGAYPMPPGIAPEPNIDRRSVFRAIDQDPGFRPLSKRRL